MTSFRIVLAAAGMLAAGCVPQPAPYYPPPLSVETAEYIRLGEGPCFGTCPVYELTLYPGGSYVLLGEQFTESGQARTDNKPAEDSFEEAQAILIEGGFADLPDDITPGNEDVCPQAATDFQTSEITIGNMAGYYRTVTYYQGCFVEPVAEMFDALRGVMRVADLVAAKDRGAMAAEEPEQVKGD